MGVLEIAETALERQLDDANAIEDLEADTSGRWLEPLWRAFRPMERLSDDELRGYVPERTVSGLQPYLPYRIYSKNRAFVGDLPVYHGEGSLADTSKAAAIFARHTLYCNRVVIDDPMWWVVCDQVGWYDGELHLPDDDRERLRSRRTNILGWLSLLRAIRPLLASERVVLLPPTIGTDQAYWRPNPPKGIQQPANLASAPEIETYRREIVGFDFESDEDRQLFLDAHFGRAVDEMSVQLQASAFHHNRLDLSPVNLLHPIALQALLERGALSAPDGAKAASGHAAALATLTTLPAFLDIGDNPSDLVGLATSDEGFADWRAGMGKALAIIATYDPTTLNFEGRVRTAFENELHDAVVRLAKAKTAATWRGALTSNLSSISVSAVGAGAAAGLAALIGAAVAVPFGVAGAAVAYGGRALWTYSRGAAAREQGRAAQTLYEILSGKS